MRHNMNSFKPHLLILAILVLIAGCSNITTAATSNTIQISSAGTIIYSAPLRHIDFETGDFSQVPPGDTHGDNGLSFPTIVTDRVHSGTYAAQCRLDNLSVSVASEIRMWGWSPETLPPLYYSFWIYVEAGYRAPAWNLITEWNSPAPYYGERHIDLCFANNVARYNELYMNFYQLSWAPSYDIQSGVSLPTGQWVHFEIYFVTSMTNGLIQVEMDGNLILEWRGRTQFEPTDGNTAIAWQLDNYCGSACSPHSFWFDDIWIDYVSHSP